MTEVQEQTKPQTKAELLDSLTVADLKKLASDKGVTLTGDVKNDHVDQLTKSRKVTRTDVEAVASPDADPDQAARDAQADPETGRALPPTPEADAGSEVSPTGNANVAGTPQNALSQATPMTDESGSNIPAANLRQPLAEGADAGAGASKGNVDSLDQALVDPETAAKERVAGRTSDASLRKADGPQIDEVPADIGSGNKPSDGGPEAYPFPQGGDVDVATVDPGTGKGEYYPNLEIDDTVILGEHELVPERLVGRRAFILDAPRYLVPMDEKDNVWIRVRTRDEVNATLHIPLAAVKEVQKGGSGPTVRG